MLSWAPSLSAAVPSQLPLALGHLEGPGLAAVAWGVGRRGWEGSGGCPGSISSPWESVENQKLRPHPRLLSWNLLFNDLQSIVESEKAVTTGRVVPEREAPGLGVGELGFPRCC